MSNNRERTSNRVFVDHRLCDFCGKEGKKKCSQCNCSIYCSRECQKKDWNVAHRPVCKLLKECSQVPIIDQYLGSMRASPTQIGIARTRCHGRLAFVMERKEWYHASEADREVVLASTTDLTEPGIIEMICNSILYPEYDNDLAGSRRPDAVCIHAKSFQNDIIVRTIASFLTRLHVRVVDLGNDAQNSWCLHWLCIQNQWLDELIDADFLHLIGPERRVPYSPNGQARKNASFIPKQYPRLDPTAYPSLESALDLPFEENKSTRGLWIACSEHQLFVCYHGPDGFSLRYYTHLALQPNRRPYPEDVILCILHVIVNSLQVRPVGAWLGQPSICSHNDVEIYEKALDGKLIEGSLTLGAMNSMEMQLEGMLPRFEQAGLLESENAEEVPGSNGDN
jgi:MYND finger